MKKIIAIMTILFSLTSVISGDEWMAYGPDFSGFSESTVLRPPLRLKWVTRVFDNFKSGPVVAEGKLLALGRTGNLFCLDAETGELLWRYSIKRNTIPGTNYGAYSYGSREFPYIYQGKVYANLFWHGYPEVSGMHCFDLATGNLLWRSHGGYLTRFGTRLSPRVVDNQLVFISNRNTTPSGTTVYKPFVVALNPLTGDSLWAFKLADTAATYLGLVVAKDTIFAACRGRTVALTKSGVLIWEDTTHSVDMSTLSYYSGRLYINNDAAKLSILSSTDGSFIRGDNNSVHNVCAFSSDRYWVRTYGSSPRAYSIANGALQLQCQYAPSTTGCGPVTIANGFAYLGHGLTSGDKHVSMGHSLRAYDMSTGAVAWLFKMNANVCTAPAVAYDKLYITSGGNSDLIYCFENE
jgi:outer membrane protein assembly factor BamB